MIARIKITLTSGKRYTLKSRDELENINPGRECVFVLNNGKVYSGLSDGEVDAEGFFWLASPGKDIGLGLPFRRLIGWAYKRKKKS